MNEPSPYQPPSSPAPPPPLAQAVEPSSIKVFGILHLVFGGLGLLTGLWGLVSSMFSSRLVGFGLPADGDSERILRAQRAYLDEIAWVGWLGSGFTLILAGLLVRAGVGLVRKRADGLVWSNRYAWTSIATKVVNMVLAVLVTVPAVNRMIDAMNADGVPGGETMGTVMRISATVGGLLGALVTMVYPVLALVLLNREPVRAFLKGRDPSAPGGVEGSASPR